MTLQCHCDTALLVRCDKRAWERAVRRIDEQTSGRFWNRGFGLLLLFYVRIQTVCRGWWRPKRHVCPRPPAATSHPNYFSGLVLAFQE